MFKKTKILSKEWLNNFFCQQQMSGFLFLPPRDLKSLFLIDIYADVFLCGPGAMRLDRPSSCKNWEKFL